jgi:hypothetical protein
MAGDFLSCSVAHGLEMGEFDSLPPRIKKKMIRLMARVAENSYRRGFQHGVVIGGRRCIEPEELRFRRSLDKSPYTDKPRMGHSSVDRLFMECRVLNELGLRQECRSR